MARVISIDPQSRPHNWGKAFIYFFLSRKFFSFLSPDRHFQPGADTWLGSGFRIRVRARVGVVRVKVRVMVRVRVRGEGESEGVGGSEG